MACATLAKGLMRLHLLAGSAYPTKLIPVERFSLIEGFNLHFWVTFLHGEGGWGEKKPLHQNSSHIMEEERSSICLSHYQYYSGKAASKLGFYIVL